MSRAYPYEDLKRWRNRHRDRYRAHRKVDYAIITGRLVRPETCSRCGAGGRIEGHHEDYARPLDVIWLCLPCHRKLHREAA